ncbi:RNA-guided endonuclease InsQ/TnpB family protein [Thermogemmatispora carboxidivorans]|uniref:RNA-guided endonuclease InsQ/TnpB family protein n=1 Tax=Thermogemmatispora carboxidivorans TaxID=1382306 RepID=UPI00069B944B|nr:RNA-guided endonuclease TnpB family protein [Thermogemmatispora carboxidivorans]
MAQVQRTIPLLLPADEDLRGTLTVFQRVQQQLSAPCFNGGKPLSAVALQRACYHEVKGQLNAQMTCTAIRLVAAAYQSAQSNRRPPQRPFQFQRRQALFLIGPRGRDARLCPDGTLSIWTVAGRKRLPYQVPEAFQPRLAQAQSIDSLTVLERAGKLLGRLTITLEVPDPPTARPETEAVVGIDLNETNALVAVDGQERVLFVSGKAVKVRNRRTAKTRARLQRKLAAHKAQHRDTRSVRRVLKRLGRKQRHRTQTFAQTVAKRLVEWAPPQAVLVFEQLQVPPPQKEQIRGRALRRRLALWQRGLIRRWTEQQAQERGLCVVEVNPAYTSQICSRCGQRGNRRRHAFACLHCGFLEHADINAARNIRARCTVLRGSGLPSTSPEARADKAAGKPLAEAGDS